MITLAWVLGAVIVGGLWVWNWPRRPADPRSGAGRDPAHFRRMAHYLRDLNP